jgi:glyoxylase-like metal-dependent hydrolase (beta-lactamase superfamily II)
VFTEPDSPPRDIEVVELSSGLHVVRLPLPMRVAPVNAYVGIGSDGATIVDTGLSFGAEQLWPAALAACGVAPGDVCRIVITHFHPDHIGAAGPLASLTGAEVVASPVTVAQTPVTWGPDMHAGMLRIDAQLLEHGVPASLVEALAPEHDLARAAVTLPPHIGVLAEGEELAFAGTTWRMVATPGHSDGHLVLVDEANGRLLAGDHVLERISPAIGRFPDHGVDPLGDYLDSLERTAALGVDLVLPGHGEPFPGLADRCTVLVRHHRERIDACTAAVAAHGDAGATAYEVALEVFGAGLDPGSQRFAVTEALAHLEYVRLRDGLQLRPGDDGVLRYW